MRILVVNNFYAPFEVGGAEESLRLQCEALVRMGNEVDVFSVAHDGESRRADVNGVGVHYFKTLFRAGSPLNSSRSLLARLGWQFGGMLQVCAALRGIAYMRARRYDVVYVNNLPGIGRWPVIAGRLMSLPVIAGLRDYAWICLRQSRFQGGRNCENTCAKCLIGCLPRRYVARSISGVAANSKVLMQSFRAAGLFISVKSKVIYAGAPCVGPSEHSPRPRGLTVGVMGQIQASKGFELFLEEITSLVVAGRISVVVTGAVDTEYASLLRERFEGARVIFTGRLPREDFFSRVDVVVIPSLWNEPLSRITYEAMAYGKCIVASMHGGQREIIENGKNGFLYEPGDGSIAVLIAGLADDPSEVSRISGAASLSAQSYQPERAADDLMALFEEVIDG